MRRRLSESANLTLNLKPPSLTRTRKLLLLRHRSARSDPESTDTGRARPIHSAAAGPRRAAPGNNGERPHWQVRVTSHPGGEGGNAGARVDDSRSRRT